MADTVRDALGEAIAALRDISIREPGNSLPAQMMRKTAQAALSKGLVDVYRNSLKHRKGNNVKYYKNTVDLRHKLQFEIRARGAGSDDTVLATTDDSVFADRIVDLLNEDEAIEKLIGKWDPGAAAELLELALAQPRT